MKKDYRRINADAKAAIRPVRAILSAKGLEAHDIAAVLIMEALVELYGLEFGDETLSTIGKRCIGYSEELMGMCVVEQFRNAGHSPEAVAKVESKALAVRSMRSGTDMAVVDEAARRVTERRGPFPTDKDMVNWPKS